MYISLLSEDVFQKGSLFTQQELCNGLCVINTTCTHFTEVSHEHIQSRGKRSIEMRVEEQQVNQTIVKDQRTTSTK